MSTAKARLASRPARRKQPRSPGVRPTDEQLLEACVPTVAQIGPERVSMDEIAVGADTTKQTLYAHFGSKDALLERLVEREFADLRSRLLRAADELPLDLTFDENIVRARLRPLYDFAEERPQGFRLLQFAGPRRDEIARTLFQDTLAVGRREFDLLNASLDAGSAPLVEIFRSSPGTWCSGR